MPRILTRRHLIGAVAALALPDLAFAQGELAATPACHDGDAPTVRQTDGPFFKPSSPERTNLLEPGMAGQRLELVGFVLSRSCKPVSGALIDFWQADGKGEYDNSGFRLRGHQFADAQGRYRLTLAGVAAGIACVDGEIRKENKSAPKRPQRWIG